MHHLQGNDGRVLRVLVVDDDQDTADALTLLTQIWGHSARTAYGGLSALSLFDLHRPDVVIAGLDMAATTGHALAREIRARDGGERAILISHSGYASKAQQQAAFDAGFDHFIGKPIDPPGLERFLSGVARYVWLLANLLAAERPSKHGRRSRSATPRIKGRMPRAELTVAEPCYLLLKESGLAETINLGGTCCLCLFTDTKLVGPFCLGQYGGDFAFREVGTLSFNGPRELHGFLRTNEATLAARGIRHLAIDPAANLSVARVPIRAFIESAEWPQRR